MKIFLIITMTCSAVFGQEGRISPSPENIDERLDIVSVLPQADSPLVFKPVRLWGSPPTLHFEVKNVGTKGIRAFIIAGFPESRRQPGMPYILDHPLQPGASRSFSIYLPVEFGSKSIAATVDLVAFSDRKSWGPDTKGESEFLRGFVEGQRDVVFEARELLAGDNDAAIIARFKRQPFFPNTPYLDSKSIRWRQGYNTGVGRLTHRAMTEVDRREWRKTIISLADDIEASGESGESRNKKLKKISRTFGIEVPPVTILELKRGTQKLALDEWFTAEKDWIRGLSIRLRNDSGKTIKYFTVEMSLPETETTGNAKHSSTTYGCSISFDLPCPRPADLPIPPGAEFEIVLADEKSFSNLQRFLEPRHRIDELTRIYLSFTMHFHDGTAWIHGPMVQDPENPRRFNPGRR